ncbi:MAG: alpha/beta hydrolase, partial [Chloroflexota bacterium]
MINHTDHKLGTMKEYTVSLPNGLRVRTLDDGNGPILLLLHGNPDNADEWKPLIELLRDNFRCIAPDLPGYGRQDSTYPLPASYDYSREVQISFVDDLLAQLNIPGKITLVVHDIGGIMGVPWAARHVDKLDAMIYTNTVVFPKHKWFNLAYRWGNDSSTGRPIANLSMAALGWFQGALFRRIFSRQNPQLPTLELDRFVTDFALNPIAQQTSLCEFRQITKFSFFDGYDVFLKTISDSVPTVALWGEGDPYIPTHSPEELLAQKTIVLPKVGHWVPIIAADVLAQNIRAVFS